MNKTDIIKESFDISREPSASCSDIDVAKYVIRQINNIECDNISKLFIDYVFITGDKLVAAELQEYIDELYSDELMISNKPIVRYDKNCPSDTTFWFREGQLPFVEKQPVPYFIHENKE